MEAGLVLFTLHGLLGGFIAALLRAYSWRYLKTWPAVRAYVLGAIAGYIYYWLHTDYGFPDSMMSIIVGYSAESFLRDLVDFLRARTGRKPQPQP